MENNNENMSDPSTPKMQKVKKHKSKFGKYFDRALLVATCVVSIGLHFKHDKDHSGDEYKEVPTRIEYIIVKVDSSEKPVGHAKAYIMSAEDLKFIADQVDSKSESNKK